MHTYEDIIKQGEIIPTCPEANLMQTHLHLVLEVLLTDSLHAFRCTAGMRPRPHHTQRLQAYGRVWF
jgi:hypothetical protein